jgi:hypothetical protein
MKNLSLLSIATLLGLSFTSGCVLDIGDDLGTDTLDTNDDVDTDATTDATDDATDDATTDATDDATDDDVGTTDATDDATDDATTDATTTADETTDGGAMCGWDPRGGFYECGFEGEDPEGTNPIACPDGLVYGEECPEGLSGQGCCDGDGNNWYCTQEGFTFLNACG